VSVIKKSVTSNIFHKDVIIEKCPVWYTTWLNIIQ